MERASKNLVIDASVAAKWFIPEPDSMKALKLRNKHIEGSITLMAPDLLIYEIANALSYHPDIEGEALKEDLEALFMIDIELIPPSSEYIAAVAETARLNSVTVYDSSYITLAEATATNLITADKKLYDKVTDNRKILMLDEMDTKWITS